jgi:hypothetical protein
MTDEQKVSKEILFGLYQDNINQGRHHETQRATVTSSILAIDAIIIGLITFDKCINSSDVPLTIFLTVLGIFGAAFTLKHYERYSLHMQRARVYRNKLDKIFMDGLVFTLKKNADEENDKEFPILKNLRLHYWWTALHLIVSVIGTVLTIIAIFFIQKA